MWMVERSDGACLALKKPGSFPGCIVVVIFSRFGSYHLDGNLAVNTRITGKIDLAHAAASK